MKVLNADFIVIGSGLAGSVAAHLLSTQGDVLLLSKASPAETNSFAAQGGIAAAIDTHDHANLHARDTMEAGGQLCSPQAVAYLTSKAPKMIDWLRKIGVPFDQDGVGGLALGLEAAHSRHRILHAGGDSTGRKVMETITAAMEDNPTIQRVANVQVLSLIQNHKKRVVGAVGQFGSKSDELIQFYARRAVILATGGMGQLFERTTNPAGATGDGIPLAYRAGASIRNLEFMQFHPTTLDLEGCPSFLISEAVRGAGGRLIDHLGDPVMKQYPLSDLEPRDVVARAIYSNLGEGKRVYLDCRDIRDFATKFPTIFERCRSYGLDPEHNPIPVSPAAHFMMGGIVAEMTGKTEVPGLYAIGEVASTGAHGANRLASNSLLECLVMAFSLAEHMQTEEPVYAENLSRQLDYGTPLNPDSEAVLTLVKTVMWKAAGIVRHAGSLQNGLDALANLQPQYPQSPAICSARLILQCALARQESRGAHFRSDFPHLDPRFNQVNTVVRLEAKHPLSMTV